MTQPTPPLDSEHPRVHPADWTPQRVAGFWDNYGSIPHFRTRMFSLVMGEGILEFVQRFVATDGVFLDYGCGRGDLLDVLLRRGRRSMGCDSSPANVRAIEERFAKRDGFLGAFQAPNPQLPVAPDIITVVEVIEHMPPSAVDPFLAGIGALLRPGAHVFISCPNREDIAAAEVLCPECGCQFHPVQHMQSLTPEEVATFAERAGFEKIFAGATRFRRVGEPRLLRWIIGAWYSLRGRAPHLVYVGRKR